MGRPEGLRYSSTHEWVRVNDDSKIATIGITDFAVEQLNDLVFIELPEAGDAVSKETAFGEIESTKTVSELYAPVSGTITAVNSAIADNLDILKDSPFEEGWLLKIEMSAPGELDGLLSAASYEEHIASAEH